MVATVQKIGGGKRPKMAKQQAVAVQKQPKIVKPVKAEKAEKEHASRTKVVRHRNAGSTAIINAAMGALRGQAQSERLAQTATHGPLHVVDARACSLAKTIAAKIADAPPAADPANPLSTYCAVASALLGSAPEHTTRRVVYTTGARTTAAAIVNQFVDAVIKTMHEQHQVHAACVATKARFGQVLPEVVQQASEYAEKLAQARSERAKERKAKQAV